MCALYSIVSTPCLPGTPSTSPFPLPPYGRTTLPKPPSSDPTSSSNLRTTTSVSPGGTKYREEGTLKNLPKRSINIKHHPLQPLQAARAHSPRQRSLFSPDLEARFFRLRRGREAECRALDGAAAGGRPERWRKVGGFDIEKGSRVPLEMRVWRGD